MHFDVFAMLIWSIGGDEIGKAADIGIIPENHEEVLQILEHYRI